jgi:hypothetical protein
MAVEVAELSPWLLSDEETITVESGSPDIIASSKLHNGKLLVMAVNRLNQPKKTEIRIKRYFTGKARVIFENRLVNVTGGYIPDQIQAFGSLAYLIDLNSKEGDVSRVSNNLIRDPGFEDLSSPGVPASCYVGSSRDRGATFFLDSRESIEGDHSLRIITPDDNKSVSLKFFPFRVKAGASYAVSIWAKSDPEQRTASLPDIDAAKFKNSQSMPQYVEILFGAFSRARFVPDKEWKRYMTFVTVPKDTLASFRTNIILKMPGHGVAWFDMLQVVEDE